MVSTGRRGRGRRVPALGGQPLELVATSALNAMCGAVQGLVDVRRDERLVGPVSINTTVVAKSGERKTACDKEFSAAAERWERAERRRLAPARPRSRRLATAIRRTRRGCSPQSGRRQDPRIGGRQVWSTSTSSRRNCRARAQAAASAAAAYPTDGERDGRGRAGGARA